MPHLPTFNFMNIEKLELRNFRNHKNIKLEFTDGVTLIHGPNGAGKTNILEAVYLLATAKSPKTRYDKDLINYEHEFATIKGFVFSDQYHDDFLLEVQLKTQNIGNTSTKKLLVNKVAKAQKNFCGLFNAVLFTPLDLELVTGSPGERRGYMDHLLSQTHRDYKVAHDTFTKAVRQRNKLLENIRDYGSSESQLEFWDEKIISSGTEIQKRRTELVNFLNSFLADTEEKFECVYKINKIDFERVTSHRSAEIAGATTLVGPHRDDLEFLMAGKNADQFASRGQQRSIVLNLKLAEIDYIEKIKLERPVLLLDDIFSEFDAHNRQKALDAAKRQQTIISATELFFVDKRDVGRVIEL